MLLSKLHPSMPALGDSLYQLLNALKPSDGEHAKSSKLSSI